jgi:transposase
MWNCDESCAAVSVAPDRPPLTDGQWEAVTRLLPGRRASPNGGRPRADDRACLEGILWVLRSGARWRDLPDRYPSAATCWRRLTDWEDEGVWLPIWYAALGALDADGRRDWEAAFAAAGPAAGKPDAAGPAAKRPRNAFWRRMAREFRCYLRGSAAPGPAPVAGAMLQPG